MSDLKEKYIELIRKRTYLMETKYLYPSHADEITKINIEIEKIKEEMRKEINGNKRNRSNK